MKEKNETLFHQKDPLPRSKWSPHQFSPSHTLSTAKSPQPAHHGLDTTRWPSDHVKVHIYWKSHISYHNHIQILETYIHTIHIHSYTYIYNFFHHHHHHPPPPTPQGGRGTGALLCRPITMGWGAGGGVSCLFLLFWGTHMDLRNAYMYSFSHHFTV